MLLQPSENTYESHLQMPCIPPPRPLLFAGSPLRWVFLLAALPLVLPLLACTTAGGIAAQSHLESRPLNSDLDGLDKAKRPLSPEKAEASLGSENTPARTESGQSMEKAPEEPPMKSDGKYDPEHCLDQELAARGLDQYGHPKGLSYAGGSPLFNERTGERISRREYVGRRIPELLERCPEEEPSQNP